MGSREYDKWVSIGEAEFDGDVLITDPSYLCEGSGEPWCDDTVKGVIEAWGGLFSETFYGDWGCTVYRTDGKIGEVSERDEEIGHFCADTGLVCVVDMGDVANVYSPGFDNWLKRHEWCGTVIRNFKGKVRLMKYARRLKLPDGTEYDHVDLRVRGDGEIDGVEASFESVQTEA